VNNIKQQIENIKDILSPFLGEKKVFDKDVASALFMPEDVFYSRKHRDGSIAEEILCFCKRTGVNPMDIFFGGSNGK